MSAFCAIGVGAGCKRTDADTSAAARQAEGKGVGSGYAVAANGLVATDCNGSAPLQISQTPAAGTLVGLGVTTVTLHVLDAANNESTCTANFTVSDNTAPVITTCAGDQSTFANINCQSLVPDFYDPFRNPPFFAAMFAPLALLDLMPLPRHSNTEGDSVAVSLIDLLSSEAPAVDEWPPHVTLLLDVHDPRHRRSPAGGIPIQRVPFDSEPW